MSRHLIDEYAIKTACGEKVERASTTKRQKVTCDKRQRKMANDALYLIVENIGEIAGTAKQIAEYVEMWYLVGLDGKRRAWLTKELKKTMGPASVGWTLEDYRALRICLPDLQVKLYIPKADDSLMYVMKAEPSCQALDFNGKACNKAFAGYVEYFGDDEIYNSVTSGRPTWVRVPMCKTHHDAIEGNKKKKL